MCLIVFAFRHHPGFPLVLAANRDEYFSRPTAPAEFWEDAPHVLAGRDLMHGGTWMGITRAGRIAALTNFRDPAHPAGCRSRGEIVSEYLKGTVPALHFLQEIRIRRESYGGFSLIAGDIETLYYYSSRQNTIMRIPPGVHGLSNHLLDTAWPKVTEAIRGLEECLAGHAGIDEACLFQMLRREEPCRDDELPDTGVSRDWERALSPVFIRTPDYGTRSSTLIAVAQSGDARLVERTHDVPGGGWSEKSYRLSLPVHSQDEP